MKRTVSLALAVAILVLLAVPVSAGTGRHAGAVTTQWGSLNVRENPNSGARILTALPKGSYVTLLSRTGDWWYVEYGNQRFGYCHRNYITQTAGTAAAVKLSYGSLNVRTGPGTSYSPKDWLTNGVQVVVLSESGGWSRILYHGTKTGYVSSRYLSGGETGAVSLNVPDFKQTDSRWAHVKIGTSGKNIGQIGCATTAIAMLESYRTGTTLYPDAMAKKLTYTSSGSVYWPSHYTPVTGSLDLNQVLGLLQKGKPVLLGAKNTWGGQHWVVVTGFSGGALTPANFTVRDPGSNSRVTLAQFLDSYPTFYKFFHY